MCLLGAVTMVKYIPLSNKRKIFQSGAQAYNTTQQGGVVVKAVAWRWCGHKPKAAHETVWRHTSTHLLPLDAFWPFPAGFHFTDPAFGCQNSNFFAISCLLLALEFRQDLLS